MDGKIYYQAIVIDTQAGTYQVAKAWDGSVARKFKTLREAEVDRDHWATILPPKPNLRVGVHEVRSAPMPASVPLDAEGDTWTN